MTEPLAATRRDPVGEQGAGRRLPRALTPFRTPAYRWLAVSLTASSFAAGVWVVALVWEASLDFFVSVSLMPVSMALAGPVAALIGLQATFAVAGIVPLVVAVVATLWAGLPQDELAHPLDDLEPAAAASH